MRDTGNNGVKKLSQPESQERHQPYDQTGKEYQKGRGQNEGQQQVNKVQRPPCQGQRFWGDQSAETKELKAK